MKLLNVLANDGIDKEVFEILKNQQINIDTTHYEKEELLHKINDFDILVVRSATKVDKELIDAMAKGKTKLIIRAGVGLDNIDTAYAAEKNIAVKNTPNSSANAVAELVLGQMFNLARFLNLANITMKQGEWNKKAYTGMELEGKTLGIVGFGRIGQTLAKKGLALGMNVIYFDLYPANLENCTSVSLKEVLKNADFISLHTTATEKPVINQETLNYLKPSAFLINASRGNVIDEDALLKALNEQRIAGAALDVFVNEPTPNEELCRHPLCSVTPHIGAATAEAQNRIGKEVLQHILDYLKENE